LINDFFIKVIDNLSKPQFFPEEMQKQYFILLESLFRRVPGMFMSTLGAHFLISFGCKKEEKGKELQSF